MIQGYREEDVVSLGTWPKKKCSSMEEWGKLSMKAGRAVVMGIIFRSDRVLFQYVIVVAANRWSQHRRPRLATSLLDERLTCVITA